jgi:poly-gamma-glutamate synthesis protein (capsule biosynthesis protein)
VDCVYGHSSHHFKGIEVYNGKLILYGCGDFINDYEGISGREEYRSHLTLMYFPGFTPQSGHLMQLTLVPMKIKRFQSIHASPSDRQWIMNTLNREGKQLGTRVESTTTNDLKVVWN